MEKCVSHYTIIHSIKKYFIVLGKDIVTTYEQWNLILGVIDQEVNLSKDNVIERIKELLKEVKILGQAETSRC